MATLPYMMAAASISAWITRHAHPDLSLPDEERTEENDDELEALLLSWDVFPD